MSRNSTCSDRDQINVPASLHQLRRQAKLRSGAQQCAGKDDVDIGFSRNFPQIGRRVGESRRCERRANHQRTQSCKRSGDRIRKAERQESVSESGAAV